MFPSITLFGTLQIYTFGLSLAIAFFAFFALASRLSRKLSLNPHFFVAHAVWFVLAAFVASRVGHVIAHFDSLDSILGEGFWRFFLLSSYDFSLIGALLGVAALLIVMIRSYALPLPKVIDVVVISGLVAAIAWYIGAFLWGQVYGTITTSSVGVTYTSPDSLVPYTLPVVPLAVFYALACAALSVVLYIVRRVAHIDGITGSLGILLFGCMLLVGEFWNGSIDAWQSMIGISFTQIGALLIIAVGGRLLMRFVRAR